MTTIKASNILGKTILMVTAHPDDESFLAAGTIRLNTDAGGRCFLICATVGEKGTSHLKRKVTNNKLLQIRITELNQAAGILGINKVLQLYFPDGEVDHNEAELLKQIKLAVQTVKPDIIISFGEDGITGHKDHVSVGKISRKAAKQCKLVYGAFCLPEEVAEEAQAWLKQKRNKGVYHDGLKIGRENCFFEIDSEIKLKALKSYRSQLDTEDPYESFPAHIAKVIQNKESFCIGMLK